MAELLKKIKKYASEEPLHLSLLSGLFILVLGLIIDDLTEDNSSIIEHLKKIIEWFYHPNGQIDCYKLGLLVASILVIAFLKWKITSIEKKLTAYQEKTKKCTRTLSKMAMFRVGNYPVKAKKVKLTFTMDKKYGAKIERELVLNAYKIQNVIYKTVWSSSLGAGSIRNFSDLKLKYSCHYSNKKQDSLEILQCGEIKHGRCVRMMHFLELDTKKGISEETDITILTEFYWAGFFKLLDSDNPNDKLEFDPTQVRNPKTKERITEALGINFKEADLEILIHIPETFLKGKNLDISLEEGSHEHSIGSYSLSKEKPKYKSLIYESLNSYREKQNKGKENKLLLDKIVSLPIVITDN